MDYKNLDKNLLLIVTLCLFGTATGSYLLYNDLYSSSSKRIGKSLAALSKKESTVRRKPSNSFVWENIRSRDEIFKKDSIQTGANSSAQILLKNNTLIELSENSLVVIDDNTDLALNFIKGSLILKSDSGDKKITVDNSGKQNMQIFSAKLKLPENFTNFYTVDQSHLVEFKWVLQNNVQEDSNIYIQISKDNKFTNILKTKLIKQNNFKETFSVGKYFWRIVQDNKVLSSTSSFNIYKVNKLITTFPTQNTEISKYGNETDVAFKWTNQINDKVISNTNENEVKTRLIVSKDKQFKDVLHNLQINYQSGLATIKKLTDATYFWKIETSFKDLVVSSNVESFKIKTSQKLAIQLAQPDNETQAIQNKPIYFTWDAGTADYNYELKIYKNKKEIINKKINTSSTNITFHHTGEYEWKVVALHNNSIIGESEERYLTIINAKPIQLVNPSNNESIFYWDDPIKVNFSWKQSESNATYLFELSEVKDFRKIFKQIKTSDTEIDIDILPQGVLYWRVSEIDQKNIVLRKSEVQIIHYGIHPKLSAVKLIEPNNYFTLNILNNSNELIFKWDEIKDAIKYEFFIFSKSDRKLANNATPKPIFKSITSDNIITLSNKVFKKFKNGDFNWSVRAIDRINRAGEANSNFTFTINYGDLLAPPEVISPEVQ